MKDEREMRLWKRRLGLDAGRNIQATYEDGGSFLARLSPTAHDGRTTSGKPQFLLIGAPSLPINDCDRIVLGEKHYKALWVRVFKKHYEAVIEEEG